MISDAASYLEKLAEIQNGTTRESTIFDQTPLESKCFIDANARIITIPDELKNVGVTYDHNAETIYFEIDRYFDNEDLNNHTCVVHFMNSKGQQDIYTVIQRDLSVEGKIIFGWTISNSATKYSGTLKFSIRFYSIEDNKFTYNFGTQIAELIVLDSLNVFSSGVDVKPDLINQWIDKINKLNELPIIPTKTSELVNDSNFITTETDPTVPAWAKQLTKPTYTATEVGALPNTTNIPTQITDLTDDSNFVHNTGNETIGGVKTFTNNIIAPNITDISSQLDLKASQSDLDEINQLVAQKAGTFEVVGDDLNIYTNDTKNILVTSIDLSHLANTTTIQTYISSLVSGGTITGATIGDKSLAPGKTTFQQIDLSSVTFESGYYVNRINGNKISNGSQYYASNYIDFDYAGLYFLIKTCTTNDLAGLAFYDASNTYISGMITGYSTTSLTETIFQVPTGTKKIRFTCVGSDKISGVLLAIKSNAIDVAKNVMHSTNSNLTFFHSDELPLQEIKRDGGLFSILHKVGYIGDSLSSGEHEYTKADSTTGYIDLFDFSYGQVIARATGTTALNFSSGGRTAATWLSGFTNTAFTVSDNICKAYIIYLGTNDLDTGQNPYGMGNVSTDIDINNYNNNGLTFAGRYATIIQRIKEVQPKARIFCCTLPKSPSSMADAATNPIIRQIVDLFDYVYLLDLWQYAEIIPNDYRLGFHLTSAGYQIFAWQIMSYVDYLIRKYPAEFKEVAFIGTDYHHA